VLSSRTRVSKDIGVIEGGRDVTEYTIQETGPQTLMSFKHEVDSRNVTTAQSGAGFTTRMPRGRYEQRRVCSSELEYSGHLNLSRESDKSYSGTHTKYPQGRCESLLFSHCDPSRGTGYTICGKEVRDSALEMPGGAEDWSGDRQT
jgi:hypothetical protein